MEIISDISQSAEFLNQQLAMTKKSLYLRADHSQQRGIGTISIDIPAVDGSALETYAYSSST